MDTKDFGQAVTADLVKSPRGSALGLERTGSFTSKSSLERTGSFSTLGDEALPNAPKPQGPATPVINDLKRCAPSGPR